MLLLAGCASVFDRGSNPPGHHAAQHSAGSILLDLGYWFTWAGGAAMGLAALALAASLFVPVLGLVRTYIAEVGILGFAAVLVGSCFLWLGANPWVLAVCVAMVGAFLVLRYRRALARACGFGPVREPKVERKVA